jgi:hypothetical protein
MFIHFFPGATLGDGIEESLRNEPASVRLPEREREESGKEEKRKEMKRMETYLISRFQQCEVGVVSE